MSHTVGIRHKAESFNTNTTPEVSIKEEKGSKYSTRTKLVAGIAGVAAAAASVVGFNVLKSDKTEKTITPNSPSIAITNEALNPVFSGERVNEIPNQETRVNSSEYTPENLKALIDSNNIDKIKDLFSIHQSEIDNNNFATSYASAFSQRYAAALNIAASKNLDIQQRKDLMLICLSQLTGRKVTEYNRSEVIEPMITFTDSLRIKYPKINDLQFRVGVTPGSASKEEVGAYAIDRPNVNVKNAQKIQFIERIALYASAPGSTGEIYSRVDQNESTVTAYTYTTTSNNEINAHKITMSSI